MDAAVLLDLLGNENRRRILRLLSHRPCYVTEISEYIGVSPKAVIDHLRKLEEANLIKSQVDERRRKYFHIARNLRLEVNVSPHGFGAKSAYPASQNLDMGGRCQYISIHLSEEQNETEFDTAEIKDLAAEYQALDELESELSLAQRWVHGRITAVLDRLDEQLGSDIDSRFYAELLGELAGKSLTTKELARSLRVDERRIQTAINRLAEHGIVELHERTGEWTLRRVDER
ncbi:MAG: putative transcriptional regulator [Haloquadratum sp. J07HQX50]|jgi:Predicted transcriptional regulators|nr:MAG: putative transcriptional regulator [Haloquadratum sp. J07HQX50]